MICANIHCGKEIAEDEPYACLWIDNEGGLTVCFICIPCSELPNVKDITHEVKGNAA